MATMRENSRGLLGGFGRRIASADLWYVAISGAQVGPVDLWSHFFAADGAIGQALDAWAVLNWHAGGLPLTHGAWRDADHAGEDSLASEVLCGAVDWVHAQSLAALDLRCQAGLNLFFLAGLIVGV